MSFVALGVSVAVAGATTAVSMSAQAQAANQQNRYRRDLGISQNQQFKENAAAVIKDIGFQIDQLAQRDIQQAAATRQELETVSRNVREAGASARAQAAAAGVEGRTADLLHAQFSRDVAEFESVAARNLRNFRAQAQMEAKAIYARGQNAINQGYPNPLPPVATVSPATSIMQGISTGIGVYGSMRSFQTPSGMGPSANPAMNNPNAPYYLQANPSTAVGTPPLLAAPAGGVSLSAPPLLAR
jgi:hypothetical protein